MARSFLTPTRRQVLLAGAAGLLPAAPPASRLSVAGYIWQQYAAQRKKPLVDVVDEVLPMARHAGFQNVELMDVFFAPALRERVIELLRSNNLAVPAIYVGGGMHETALADTTIRTALECAAVCKALSCKAVVHNPNPLPGGAAKTDRELEIQAQSLNRMGRALAERGFQLRVHHHSPEMAANAREWRHILRNTDPKAVTLCLDVDWIYQGGMDPTALIREAGNRTTELHVRNSKDKLWLESFGDGDLDYRGIAALLREMKLRPFIAVELAHRPETVVTRPLEADLRLSREYAEKVFGSLAR